MTRLSSAALLVLCACAQTDTKDVVAQLSLEAPARMGAVPTSVCLRDRAGAPLLGARLSLEGNMTHPGMRPVVVAMQGVGDGCYRANLTFTMPGDWYLRVLGSLADGRPLDRSLSVQRVAAHDG